MASDGNGVGFGWVFHFILFLSLAVLFFMQVAVLVKLDKSIEKRAEPLIPTATTPAVKHPISVTKEDFGKLSDGRPVDRYTVRNGVGFEVQLITYGSIISSIKVPDKNGNLEEITLGFDDIRGYELDNVPYFGALVGRVANRIARGRFVLDDVVYNLSRNNGENHLHGGPRGWSKLLWTAHEIDDGVAMSLVSADGDEGYPGEVTTDVFYRVTGDNELFIRFQSTTKKKATPINLTTHPYFNLAGERSGSIDDQAIEIFSDRYLKSYADLIPTGEIAGVNGTVFDLRRPTLLGYALPQFNGSGFDNTYVVKGPTGKRLAARAYHSKSGRMLEVYTDQPGIQFYTGNFLNDTGRGGRHYRKHSGFCLETQNFPDAVNHENFPDSILREDSTYDHSVWYKFSVKRQ